MNAVHSEGGASDGAGSRPGAKRSRGGASSPSASSRRPSCVTSGLLRPASSNAHGGDELTVTCSVPSRAILDGHALRATDSPTQPGQASTMRAMPRAGPKRESWRSTPSPIRSITGGSPRCRVFRRERPGGRVLGSTEQRGRRARRGDERAWPRSAMRLARIRRRPGSSSERTSSRSSSGGAGPRSASRSASPRSSDRTARRCSPCEPKTRRSRVDGEHAHVVEVGAEAGRAAVEVTIEARLQLLHRRRLRVVAQRAVGQAELAGPLGAKDGPSSAQASCGAP